MLAPQHLDPLARLDTWVRLFWAAGADGSIVIRSAGLDGRHRTPCNILVTTLRR